MWKNNQKEADELAEFVRFFVYYLSNKLNLFGAKFESVKDFVVVLLMTKRGKYSQTFLNTSFLLLVVLAIVVWPAIAENNPFTEDEREKDAVYTSQVIATDFTELNAITTISDKPRDKVVDYKVKSGDTLKSVADFFDISTESIKWLNSMTSDKIKPNQNLKIPPVVGVVHKVKSGDTIYSIAKKYQTEAQNIINFPFNDYSDPDTFALTPGQVLFVPDGIIEDEKPAIAARPRSRQQIAAGQPGTGSFIWPTTGMITQYMSWYHPALDIANRASPPIIAADRGTVVFSGCQKTGYGCHIIVDHGNGYKTLYGHLIRLDVVAGQGVERGQMMGIMGSTGRSTGTHLHFEIRQGDKKLNPLSLLK